MKVRHFKISRIERVELLEHPWQYDDARKLKKIDDFRIANDSQVPIRLNLQPIAYNILFDTFPNAARNAVISNDAKSYNLDINVNDGFLGVVPFILSNLGSVEIIEPIELKRAVSNKAREFLKG